MFLLSPDSLIREMSVPVQDLKNGMVVREARIRRNPVTGDYGSDLDDYGIEVTAVRIGSRTVDYRLDTGEVRTFALGCMVSVL